MIVAICVDDKMGMTLFGRRQSKDRILRERLINRCENCRLLMNSYSRTQFEEDFPFVVSETFLEDAGEGDVCFVENRDITPFLEKTEKIILYKWNRHYPSDVKFTVSLEESGFVLFESFDFAGSSHENITEEIWIRTK